MYILGDIGNTETKIFLVSTNNKIVKKLNLSTRDINITKLNRLFINFIGDYKKVKKILFCSLRIFCGNSYIAPGFRIFFF